MHCCQQPPPDPWTPSQSLILPSIATAPLPHYDQQIERLAFNKRAGVAKVFGLVGRCVTVVTKITRIIGTCRHFFLQAFLLQLADMQLMLCQVFTIGFRCSRHVTSKEIHCCVSASIASLCLPSMAVIENLQKARGTNLKSWFLHSTATIVFFISEALALFVHFKPKAHNLCTNSAWHKASLSLR